MLYIRHARPRDSETLTILATASEAHWGYAPEFMAAFRGTYQVTEDFIERNPAFVAEEDGIAVGFYALVPEKTHASLEYLYLEPACIGKGMGKVLWDHMLAYCRQHGIQELHLVCGPQPKAFYLKMGAVETGEVDSLVTPGRKVSRMAYRIA